MQVPHDVLEAHEVQPDAQYHDDDIGYAVPECAAAVTDKPAASSCFVREGESAAERIGVSDTQFQS